ncbi:DUF2924 domain-containing protein [Oceaniglobus indicus]|uniref:DUF2924 domain-containing protein n=1 Tax=Oceaniglobus indicus TaxID=2047749 RepID=UPI000C177BD0|nr:DUF2924 domain-containing protein [Oceaniglobus indicus]
MPDTDVNFAPPAEALTTNERLSELAQLLAAAVDRTNPQKINENSSDEGDSSLDILTKLVREWNGVEHTVTVLAKGFEWQGRRYKSLSGAARAITGANWNGWKFFGFTPRPRISK